MLSLVHRKGLGGTASAKQRNIAMNNKLGQYWFSRVGKKSIKIPPGSADFLYLSGAAIQQC